MRPGSPPQVRGKRRCVPVHSKPDGITPAGAGKTISLPRHAGRIRDHPRRCGENQKRQLRIFGLIGSPPQVRGKLASPSRPTVFTGITPAGAGKTAGGVRRGLPHTDHPRRCGENMPLPRQMSYRLGSPPQVRGKLFCHSLISSAYRITPAGAGKTLKRSFRNQPFCS